MLVFEDHEEHFVWALAVSGLLARLNVTRDYAIENADEVVRAYRKRIKAGRGQQQQQQVRQV